MSFASPLRLLLIVAPLVLLVAYILVQRSRRKYALRFTSVDLLASVAPRRPGWQRHISAALMLVRGARARRRPRRPDAQRARRPAARHDHARDRHVGFDGGDRRARRAASPPPKPRRAASSRSCRTGLKVGLLSFDSEARAASRRPRSDHEAVLTAIKSLKVRRRHRDRRGDLSSRSPRSRRCPRRADGKKAPGGGRVDERRRADDRRATASRPSRPSQRGHRGREAGRGADRLDRVRHARTARSRSRAKTCRSRPIRRRWQQIASGSGGKSFTAASGNAAQLGVRPDPQERRLRHRAPRHDRVVHRPRPRAADPHRRRRARLDANASRNQPPVVSRGGSPRVSPYGSARGRGLHRSRRIS